MREGAAGENINQAIDNEIIRAIVQVGCGYMGCAPIYSNHKPNSQMWRCKHTYYPCIKVSDEFVTSRQFISPLIPTSTEIMYLLSANQPKVHAGEIKSNSLERWSRNGVQAELLWANLSEGLTTSIAWVADAARYINDD
uniref:Uncharacterized protein n=1 Tax=Heterorhabditis bacteriophora TaxID=37862 RepID=A0A1I7X1D9_HETBA